MLKELKFIPIVMAVLVGMMVVVMAAYTMNDRRVDYDIDLGDTFVPQFTHVEVSFDH